MERSGQQEFKEKSRQARRRIPRQQYQDTQLVYVDVYWLLLTAALTILWIIGLI